MIKTYITRESYLNRIKPFIGKDLIKVLVGQRRVGKSYMLYQIMDLIRAQEKDANIILIDKELHEFDALQDYRSLAKYVEEKTTDDRQKNYLFIDEIQDIDVFEKALRSFNASGKYDIYCTGSNAKMLSSELSTNLSGRYIEIDIHSLSYAEFLLFHALEETDETFLKYIKYGGLPYLIHLDLEDDIVYDYLRNVTNTIFFKDVCARYNIRNVTFLERLVEYVAENLGSLVSAKRISDFLKSQRVRISPNIVLDYLSHLCLSFLIYRVPRQDVKGKKVFEINEKYYFEDVGLRHTLVRYTQADVNKVLENLVFRHLIGCGYDVKVGQLGEKEIDFACEKNGERLYIQVAYTITEENREREFGNLLEIDDNYPKLVLSMDPLVSDNSYKGILHRNIRTFLASPELDV